MSYTIIRPSDPFPDKVQRSIYLLGPILYLPFLENLSWKPEAYRLLDEMGYDGVVYDPEDDAAMFEQKDYETAKQIEWETAALNRADIIAAWVPPQVSNMPDSTNFELGEWYKSGKLILGYPDDADQMVYIDYRLTAQLDASCHWRVPIFHNLRAVLQTAISRLGDGALREGVETTIPLDIWQDLAFQKWYRNLLLGRHGLEDFKVEYVYFRRQNESGRPLQRIWAIRPKVAIAGEDRSKNNEVVIGRPATVSVLLYYPTGETIYDWKIVLVNEYRPAVMNSKGRVYELPGGRIEPPEGPHDESVILASAVTEVFEEVGLKLDAFRLRPMEVQVRQTHATLVAQESYFYSCCLADREYEEIEKLAEAQCPPANDNDEFTRIYTSSIWPLLAQEYLPLDWINLGMIMTFVADKICSVRSRLKS